MGGSRTSATSRSAQIDLRRATGRSVNTVYAELNILAGPDKAMKAAEDAGVRSSLEDNMANVLGTDYVTVMDMASAYATIAAEGVRADPYIVKEIRFLDESVPTIKAEKKTQQVFDKDLMSDVIDAMTYPVEGGTARYVGENLGRPAAGKTGTSESFRSAWFNGYVPQLETAVGLYRSGKDGEELQMEDLPEDGNITGGTFPRADLDRVHGEGPRGHQGGAVPGAGRHQQGCRPAAAHDERAPAHDERAPDDERAADHEGPSGAGPLEDEVEREADSPGPPTPEPSETFTPLLPAPG